MSGLLAGKIWQSALDPKLKPIAAALADIADHDGSHIFPSVAYIAWLLGDDPEPPKQGEAPRMERTIQRGLQTLKRMGVLVEVNRRRAAFSKSNSAIVPEYQMVEAALPQRKAWQSRYSSDETLTDRQMQKRGDNLSPLAFEGVTNDDEGVTNATRRGDTGVTLTVIEPSREPSTPSDAREVDVEIDQVAAIFGRFGLVNGGTADAIAWTVKDYGIDWTKRAIRTAASSAFDGRPPWSYIDSICERWKKQGGPDDDKPRPQTTQRANGGSPRGGPVDTSANASERAAARINGS